MALCLGTDGALRVENVAPLADNDTATPKPYWRLNHSRAVLRA